MFPFIDNVALLDAANANANYYDFVEMIKDDDPSRVSHVSVGKELYGYIREVKIHQNWKFAMDLMAGSEVLSTASCSAYGFDAAGAANTTVCPYCNSKSLDLHKEKTCYMVATDDTFGNSIVSATNDCNWRCHRCKGPLASDCH
jgi:hypothetical protein